MEIKLQVGARNMLEQLTDLNAYQQCEMNLNESHRRIEFLKGEMKKLRKKKREITGETSPNSVNASVGSIDALKNVENDQSNQSTAEDVVMPRSSSLNAIHIRNRSEHVLSHSPSNNPLSTTANRQSSGNIISNLFINLTLGRRSASSNNITTYSTRSSTSSLSYPSLPDIADKEPVTVFDLLKCETGLSNEKIAYKLREIKWKLDVETKVKTGTEKLFTTINRGQPEEQNKKRIQEIQDKLLDSSGKVTCLTKALQRYQGLYIGNENDIDIEKVEEEEHNDENKQTDLLAKITGKSRKIPTTGKFLLRIITATNLPGRKSHKSDSYCVIRIDNTPKGKTRSSRHSKWNEDFNIPIDKASDVEITVYEKGGTVLAMSWFKFGELIEELQSKGLYQGGTIENLSSPPQNQPHSDFHSNGIDVWLDMEPAGQIFLHLNLIPETRKKRRKSGVIRSKPVKKFVYKRGHKFAAANFYQVMKCAFCGGLFTGGAYQCTECKYTCHKKCYKKVITKCITKTDQEKDEDESVVTTQIMKHKIPHRFEYVVNYGVNWCCHCGYMLLPLGKKQKITRCSECSAICHEHCMPMVPNFCGMSPELAITMMEAIEHAEREKKRKLDESNKLKSSIQLTSSPPQHNQPNSTSSSPTASISISARKKAGSEPNLLGKSYPGPTNTIPEQKPSVTSPVSAGSRPVSTAGYIPGTEGNIGLPFSKVSLEDFNFLAVIGKGNFGKVMLAEEKTTGGLYAIKVLKKEFIIENDEIESTKSEKRVFMAANQERHPFLVNLHSCFQTSTRIYFVMEYISGGDLMWHIQHQQFNEKRAKFYACEVLLALEYFHKNNIVYRDLKLDNILLTLEGHIKITDYGLCKENMYHGATTNTFCGTPEFMAPEILLEKPYTRSVDWWAFGVLIYEMLLGQSPFKGDDEEEIFEAILEDDILYPINMSKDSVSLLQKLLTKDPNKRLGSGPNDAEDIKKHAYFKHVKWDKILNKEISPPYKPKINSRTDVSNFDEEFTREIPVLTPCNCVLNETDQEEFKNFSYISNWALGERAKNASSQLK
ncbi:hypothetical protein LY90DRAFT_189999 [Neocallimastix californiae]|jgi:classical protein kinase C/novel protein kinase C epsilon type|uniref:protein kinase C n=1 Tax=Neocallimastix californiae TaxID=1754190 RepID=A0A1Y1ZN65_9FUNG|nr:hypothetical protein LY90DRAFT_189999 [Neocallimastix californiae]|eukprot:ORY11668.1 hypothetical protein LY90DRAFT_189999 [Neocallimastix californiae]